MMLKNWYIGDFFFDDLRAVLMMCNLQPESKADKDFLKEYCNIPKSIQDFTKQEVINAAYIVSYYRCYKDTCECKDLFLLDHLAKMEGVTPPENIFPIADQNDQMNIWGGVV